DRFSACAEHRSVAGVDDFTLPGAARHYPPDLELEPIHLDIDATLEIPAERCSATVTTTVVARRAGAAILILDAVAFEDVVVADADGRPLTSSYDGKQIRISWDAPFAIGEERRVRISYLVEHPTGGLYFSYPTDAYPDRPVFAATDHETERAR